MFLNNYDYCTANGTRTFHRCTLTQIFKMKTSQKEPLWKTDCAINKCTITNIRKHLWTWCWTKLVFWCTNPLNVFLIQSSIHGIIKALGADAEDEQSGTNVFWSNWAKAHGETEDSRQFRLLNLWLDKWAGQPARCYLSVDTLLSSPREQRQRRQFFSWSLHWVYEDGNKIWGKAWN